ncbi:MAG: radical SAM protein [Flavobacteriales bacterium]|nr:MAG: radical SAM protein [Flavobacteriales bacterium]
MEEPIRTRTILSRLRTRDTLFGITYNMNLYRGCSHGCIYCDTRSTCYGIGDISRIRIKENAVALLEKELSGKKGPKATIGTGSMNDPYMPCEKRHRLTRSALEIIARHGFPVHVITKSGLVARDKDILSEISGKSYAAVSFTVTTSDDTLARITEPGATPPSLRFNAMEKLASAGIYTGVTMMPILPFINDRPENITEIMRMAASSGASYVLPMFGVTLREGSRDFFYSVLDKHFPGIKGRYEQTFANRYECFSPRYADLRDVFLQGASQYGLSGSMRFYEPPPPAQLSMF